MTWYSLYKQSRYGGSDEERSIWYHGTKGRNLPKILSEGLVAYPKQRAWQEDKGSSFYMPSRASLGGVYLTDNLMTARTSSWTGSDRHEDMIIVVVEAQPRTFLMDEDDISVAVRTVLDRPYLIAELYMAKVKRTNKDYVDSTKKKHIDNAMVDLHKRFIISEQASAILRKILNEKWDVILNRQAAYVDDSDWKYAFHRNISEKENKMLNEKAKEIEKIYGDKANEKYSEYVESLVPPKPDKGIAEAEYANLIDSLTRLLKSGARPSRQNKNYTMTARVDQNIGFSGSNRIVCILKENSEHEVEIVYGTPPQKLIRDWKEVVSSDVSWAYAK